MYMQSIVCVLSISESNRKSLGGRCIYDEEAKVVSNRMFRCRMLHLEIKLWVLLAIFSK